MLEDVTNNLKKSIEFAKAYCNKHRMIIVRVDVPLHIYHAIKEHYYNLTIDIIPRPIIFDVEQLCGVPIAINTSIKRPQYIMEYNGDEYD